MPLLLLLLLGMVEYGHLFLRAQDLQAATATGARQSALSTSTTASVEAAIELSLTAAGIASGSYEVQLSPPEVSDASPGSLITVTVTLDYSQISITEASFIPTPEELESNVTITREGSQ